MKALTFAIELLEPLLIAKPVTGDENSAATLDFIPGSVVRGALVQAFTKGKRGNLNDERFRKLFFGTARFLNAYPAISGVRGLPTPRSWQRDKDASERDSVVDLANNSDALQDRPFKGIGQPFTHIHHPQPIIAEDDRSEDETDQTTLAETYAPQTEISVHIAQNDRLNAVRTDTGTIYRYEALAAGQKFIGAILCEEDDVRGELAELLPNALYKLGKSSSAGYGAVRVTDLQDHSDWHEYAPAPKAPDDYVVVTLLSDVILRDPASGACAASLGAWLDEQPLRHFARCHVVGGFNLAWGLPLPQAYAIQAGSVFVFCCSDALMERLQQAEVDGIGDRLIDGFGRIAVNWHTAPELSIRLFEQQRRSAPKTLSASSAEYQLAQRMVDRIWRAQLDAALRDAIGRSKIERPPNNAQLSRMRLLAREAWRTGSAKLIGDVLKEPDKDGKNRKAMKQHAREQFQRSRISIAGESKRLIEWMKSLSDKPETVWDMLQVDQLKRPVIGGVMAKDPPALEYAARLIEGVLRKSAKEGGD